MTVHKYEEITHWPQGASDGFGGWTFGVPVLLEGRWERKSIRSIEPTGEEFTSIAVAYLPGDIDTGDWLAQGDQTATPQPQNATDAFRVRTFEKVTDLRLVQSVRKAIL